MIRPALVRVVLKNLTLPAEFSAEPHVRGICSMARSQSPNSANSQFFIVYADAGFLDNQYTVWGRVIEGMDNVDKFKRGEPVDGPDSMVSVKVAADAMDKPAEEAEPEADAGSDE